MRESTVYEAACEVRDMLREVGGELCSTLNRIGKLESFQARRRDRFAAELFTIMVRDIVRISGTYQFDKTTDLPALAASAWELADALDQADPKRTAAAAGDDVDDDEDGIDLAQERDRLDEEDERRRPGK